MPSRVLEFPVSASLLLRADCQVYGYMDQHTHELTLMGTQKVLDVLGMLSMQRLVFRASGRRSGSISLR